VATGVADRLRKTVRLGRALRLVWDGARGPAAANFVIVVLSSLVPLAILYVTKLIVDAAAAGIGNGVADGFERVAWLIAAAALLSLLGTGLQIAAGLVGEVQRTMVTDHVLGVLYAQSASVDLAHHEDPAYHERLLRTQREAPHRPGAVLATLTNVVYGAVMLVGVVALLFAVHPVMALVLFVAALPGMVVRLRFSNHNYQWLQKRAGTERELAYVGWLLTTEPHARELRVWGIAPLLIERFRALRGKLRTEQFALMRGRSWADLATQAAAAAAVFGSIAYIAHQTMLGALTIGALVMYFQAVQRGQGAMQDVLGGLSSLYEHNLFLSNLDEFLALEATVAPPERPVPVPAPMCQGLAVRGVSFAYPFASRPALRAVDLEVRRGEMVAIVGANGSGKSTLIKLLARLYDPDAGSVSFDGVDVRRFDPAEWRRNVAVVFQDFTKYSLSVRDNVCFGDVHAPPREAALEEAVRDAGFASALERLPQGYETKLGKLYRGGVELSGGEWQKVALARAFYSRAQVLVLDEPSSALDAHSEIQLFDRVRRHAAGRAVVVVSHRFSTVRMADRIYVLGDGAITESGTHDELMQANGTYARLFEAQAALYRSRPLEEPLAFAE
jgi:ATP-binding cassette, subfamily B, bacterial